MCYCFTCSDYFKHKHTCSSSCFNWLLLSLKQKVNYRHQSWRELYLDYFTERIEQLNIQTQMWSCWTCFKYLLYVPPSHAAVKFPPHLQRAALGRVEDQEATQDSLAVSRHVEGHTIFPPQNTLSQLLNTTHIVTWSVYATKTLNQQNIRTRQLQILLIVKSYMLWYSDAQVSD